MGILDKIADIEKEIARTQKNKGNIQDVICLFAVLSTYCNKIVCFLKINLFCKILNSMYIIKIKYSL